MKLFRTFSFFAALAVMAALVCGCASRQRIGMVRDSETGLMYGSTVTGNFVCDPAQFKTPVVKVKLRNTSGDPAIDMKQFRGSIEDSLRSKGYGIGQGSDFGIQLDVNLVYSGQFSRSRAAEYGLLGAAAGGYTGYRQGGTDGSVIGTAGGATAGAVLGSYSTEDTYLMVVDVVVGIMGKPYRKKETVISFGDTRIKKRRERAGFRGFTNTERLQLAVYAGGDNTEQSEIITGVTGRMRRILNDIL